MKFRKVHSVGELLEQLLADALIDSYQISGETVTIIQGADRHTFPSEQAYTFLKGMLRGRSWNLSPGSPSPAEEEPAARLQAEVPQAAPALGPTLDSLLQIAREMALIEGWEFDNEGHSVTLVLPSCRSRLGRDEAVLYLSECILHRLETMREEVARLSQATGNQVASGGSDRESPTPGSSPLPKREAPPVWEPLG